jgi:hypothetical protein
VKNNKKSKNFFKLADAFIALANKQSGKTDPGTVSATFLYAAARFNTFLVASSADSAQEFASRKEEFFDYFMTEYKKMLEEHFTDYHEHFDTYIDKKNN